MAKQLTIPQRLEWLLKQRGVSQNALARVANVSPQTVANTLRHGRVPQAKTTQKWAKTLGVPGSVFTAKKLSDVELMKIMKAQGSWTFSESRKKPAAKKAATRKPAARKATARKPVAKKAAVKKPVAKKAVTRKPAAKKATTRKPVAKKAAVKKPVAKKAVARKPVVKKAAVRKPVARKAVAKKPAATKRATPAARKPATTRRAGGKVGMAGINWDVMVTELLKLSKSTKPEVKVQAISALVALRK